MADPRHKHGPERGAWLRSLIPGDTVAVDRMCARWLGCRYHQAIIERIADGWIWTSGGRFLSTGGMAPGGELMLVPFDGDVKEAIERKDLIDELKAIRWESKTTAALRRAYDVLTELPEKGTTGT